MCNGLNGNLSNHYIEYNSTSIVSIQSIMTNSSELSYTLTALTAFTSYWIKVAFINSAGIGNFSVQISAETSAGSPPNPPANFEVESFGINQIAVYFTPPPENASITGYEVQTRLIRISF